MLNQYQTDYVIIEKEMPGATEYPDYKLLLKTLKMSPLFHERGRFPLQAKCWSAAGSELVVYQFTLRDDAETAEQLTIPVPTLGNDLNISY